MATPLVSFCIPTFNRARYLQSLLESNGRARALFLFPTKALAQESASKGVTVNAIAPGYIDTDMVAAVPEDVLKKIISTIPVGRLGKAEEIAHAVSFLASDGAAFMTGATLTMNGAQYIAG